MCLSIERRGELPLWTLGQPHSKEEDEGMEEWVTVFALLCRGGGDPGVFWKEGISGPFQVPGVGSKAGSLQDCLLGQRVKEVPGGHWRVGACCPGQDVEAGARHCPQLYLPSSPRLCAQS